MSDAEAVAAAQNSNAALTQLARRVQWQQSHIAGVCVDLGDEEEAMRKHPEIKRIPVTAIYPVGCVNGSGLGTGVGGR